jgi:hypothetical protein
LVVVVVLAEMLLTTTGWCLQALAASSIAQDHWSFFCYIFCLANDF